MSSDIKRTVGSPLPLPNFEVPHKYSFGFLFNLNIIYQNQKANEKKNKNTSRLLLLQRLQKLQNEISMWLWLYIRGKKIPVHRASEMSYDDFCNLVMSQQSNQPPSSSHPSSPAHPGPPSTLRISHLCVCTWKQWASQRRRSVWTCLYY